MRAPIGFRITSRRKSLGLSQAALARLVGISPSYLNLIENNKRDIGGTLLQRVAQHLSIPLEELAGRSEQKLLQDLEEVVADPTMVGIPFHPDEHRELVARFPASATAMARLHRAYAGAQASADGYADRLRSDPLLSHLLHKVLSSVTAIRSSAEILGDVPDLSEEDRQRFLRTIGDQSRDLSKVVRTLIGQFDQAGTTPSGGPPLREIDDLLIEAQNYFPQLEEAAGQIRAELSPDGDLAVDLMSNALEERYGVVVRLGGKEVEARQYHYDAASKELWFSRASNLATRRFQLARLLGELGAKEVISKTLSQARLSSRPAQNMARRALGSYLAAAIVLPYDRFLADAEAARYDIEWLAQTYSASFEQVAHRLVTMRRPGREGVPFGFLRSDPAGRLTKHFPLPGLLLPNSGHACPLWAIYAAFRTPGELVRQVVRFADGSRYLFLSRTVQHRAASFRQGRVASSVMLACDILHADRTIYGADLNLSDGSVDVPVGPSCRLCTRTNCPSRQEDPLRPPEHVQ